MKPIITVIGTTFVDFKGSSLSVHNRKKNNLGKVTTSYGGVARNVAENLAILGLTPIFLSAVNDDDFGRGMIQRLAETGVESSYMKVASNGMGIWLAILDAEGDLALSVTEVPDLNLIQELVDEHLRDLCQKSDGIALDIGLNMPIIERVCKIAKEEGVPIYAVVGNLDVVLEEPKILQQFDCFVCNQEETEVVLNKKVTTVDEAKQAVKELAEVGASQTIVTLGENGAVYYDQKSGEWGHLPVQPAQVVDCVGAGDSFFSGAVYELALGNGIIAAVERGTQAAWQVIQSESNVLIKSDPEVQKVIS